jgi:ubiquinone/menaquinone biosynthesis C-methylase UbiE
MRVHLALAFAPLVLAPSIFGQLAQFDSENLAPYIPTPQIVVEKMLEAAHLHPDDLLYDLGCGDGRVVITAAQRFGVHAVGVEIKESIYNSTRKRVSEMGIESRVRILHANALTLDLSPADVVTLFLLTRSNERLRPNFEKYLKPGARVVSYAFEIPGWTPTRMETVQIDKTLHRIYVYEIQPKKAAKPAVRK